MSLNRVSVLTPETQQIANSLVLEIRRNDPTWFELSFIDKLLDIFTAGLRAYNRYCSFKEPKPVTDIYEEVYRSQRSAFSMDMG